MSYYSTASSLPTPPRMQPSSQGCGPESAPRRASASFPNKPGRKRQQRGERKGVDGWGKNWLFKAKSCSWSRLSWAACEVTGTTARVHDLGHQHCSGREDMSSLFNLPPCTVPAPGSSEASLVTTSIPFKEPSWIILPRLSYRPTS